MTKFRMLENIKHLLKHSLIYSISNISLKASGVILLPIYTSYFTVEEYGRLGLILITIIIVSQSLILGQGLSLIRFNNSIEFRDKKRTILFTLTLLVTGVVLIFIVFGNIFINQLASLFGDAIIYESYLKIAIIIIALITLNNLFLSKIRADESSIRYTLSSLLKIFIIIILSIYLIVYIKLGIEGVLYAQMVGEAGQLLFLLPYILKHSEVKFENNIIKPSLKYGVPLIFSAMAINLLNGSDKYILKFLTSYTELGLYELGYRVAGIVNMFVILPFGLTLLPIAFRIYKTTGDKEYYAKLKTYVAFFLIWAGFSLSVYSKEIVMLFAQDPSYYPAYNVVPLIILSYVLYGVSMISSLGMYLTGKNHFVAIVTIVCAGINIGLNFWLIPLYGMMGAALNTVISFAILDILSIFASNRYYKIPYQHFKIAALFLFVILLFLITELFNHLELEYRVPIKLFFIILFPILVSRLKYFTQDELKTIYGTVKKWIKPSTWRKTIIR
jgi:O-antigen/teichoic acid export membrane protein